MSAKYRTSISKFFFTVTASCVISLLLSSHAFGQCSDFDYRKDIIIQASQVSGSGSHTDFPILISETDLDLRHTGSGGNVTNVNGYDIVFYDNNCNQLDHQVERYDNTTGEYVAWVRIPSLSTSTNTTIHIMYGNSSLSTDPSTTNVWDGNTVGVWHMNQDPSSSTMTDGTGNGNNGTAFNMTSGDLVTGKIGECLNFDGSNDYIRVTNGQTFAGNGGSFTISIWIRTSDLSATNMSFIGNYHSNSGQTPFFMLGFNNTNAIGWIRNTSSAVAQATTPRASTNDGNWHKLVMTRDNSGNTVNLYLDGTSVSSVTNSTGDCIYNNFIYFMDHYERYTSGDLDEVKIDSVARSVDWVTTQYNSQNNPSGTFYTISGEVDMSLFTSAGNGDWHTPATWTQGVIPMCSDSVVVRHQVDITSANSTICELTIVNSSGVNAEVDLSGGDTLEVTNDIQMIANSNTDNVSLIVQGNNSTVDIGDDLRVDLDDGERVSITMSDNSSIDVADDFIADMDGTTSEDLQFNLSCTGGTNHFYVHGDFSIDKDNAQEIQFNLSNDAEMQVDGNFTVDWDGANANDQDIHFTLTDNGRIDIEGNVNVDLNEAVRTLSDILVDMDNDATFDMGALVTNTATFTIVSGNAFNFELDRDAAMSVAGDLTLSHGGDNNLDITLDDNANGTGTDAQLSVGGDMTITKSDGDRFLFSVRNDSDVDIGGDFTYSCTTHDNNSQDNTIRLFEDATFDVDGSLSMTVNVANINSLIFDFDDNGAMDVGSGTGESLTLTLTDGNHLSVDLDRDASLDVFGDMTMTQGGNGNMDLHLDVNANGTGTDGQLMVDGNLTMTKIDGDRMRFFTHQHSDVKITGNLTMIDNFHEAVSQHMELEVIGDGTLDVDGEATFTLNSLNNGVNSMIFDFNDNAVVTIGTGATDNVLIDLIHGNDLQFDLDRDSRFQVANNLTINQSGDGNCDIQLNVNNGGSAADGQLIIAGNLLITKDDGDRFRMLVRNDSDVDIGGDMTITNSFHEAVSQDFEIEVIDAATLDVDGVVTLTENAVNNAVNSLVLDFDNTAVVTFGTLATDNVIIQVQEGDGFTLHLDRDSRFEVANDLTLIQSGNGNLDIDLNVNANGGTTDGQLIVPGDLTITKNDGDRFRLFVRNDSDVDIGGDLSITNSFHEAVSQHFEIEVVDNSTIDVDGAVTITENAVNNAVNDLVLDFDNSATVTFGTLATDNVTIQVVEGDDFTLHLDRDSRFEVANDLTLIQSGNGNLDIDFNVNGNGTGADGQLIVPGDLTITKDDGDRFRMLIRNDSDLDVGGDFTITNTFHEAVSQGNELEIVDAATVDVDGDFVFSVDANNNAVNDFIIDMDNTAIFTIGSGLANSATFELLDGQDFFFNLDRDARLDVSGDVIITHSGDGAMDIDLNVNANGSAADAQFVVGRDINITKDDGDRFRLRLRDGSDLDVAGDFTLSTTFHEAVSQHDELQVQDDAMIDVDGSFDWTWTSAGNAVNDLIFDLNNNGRIDVGPIGGPYNTDNMTITMTAGDDAFIDLDNSSILNVYGDLNVIKSGADEVEFFVNSNAGTDAQIHVFRDFDIDNTEDADLIYFQLDGTASLLDVDGDIDIQGAASGSRIELETNSTSKIELAGSFLRTGGFGILDMNSGSTLEFDGSTNTQQFSEDAGNGGDSFDYMNVIVNNTFGTNPQLTMEGLATVHESITFIDGVIAATATNVLVIDDNATTAGASDISHVDGEVQKTGNDVFTFPVGDDDNYQPIAISAPSLTSDHFTARYHEVDPDLDVFSDANIITPIQHVSSCEYWILDRTNGSSDVAVTLAWDVNSCGVDNLPQLLVARWDGSDWRSEGNGGTTGNTVAGTVVSSAAVTNFSPFTLASTTTNNPLPIELVLFTGHNKGAVNELNWETATEINNDYFTVERSIDGLNFASIGDVTGAGNSNLTLHYSLIDEAPVNGINYYRLKQTDFDGSYTYSNIISILVDESNLPEFVVFPNPIKNRTAIIKLGGLQKNEKLQMQLFDAVGKIIKTEKLIANSNGYVLHQIQLSQSIPTGVYFLTLQGEDGVYNKKIIIK